MHLTRLQLDGFRNLRSLDIALAGAARVVVYGHNGAGKSSLLEALSLLAPGRGVLGANLEERVQHALPATTAPAETPPPQWSLSAHTQQGHIGQRWLGGKRQVAINGQAVQRHADLAQVGSVVWLSPRQDRLFYEAPKGRRQFLDRLVYALTPTHADTLSRYSQLLKARQQVLKNPDADWLSVVEAQLAALGAAIHAARTDYLHALAPHLQALQLQLTLTDGPEAFQDLSLYQHHLADNRARDHKFAATHYGPHRTDIHGQWLNGPALDQASMGQHKRALLMLLVGHAQLLQAGRQTPPLVLLDEVTAHLDEGVRQLVFGHLRDLGAAVWLTGTERSLFQKLPRATTQWIKVHEGTIFTEVNHGRTARRRAS